MMSVQWRDIRNAIQLLRESGASDLVFGAMKHKFVTNPCLSEREVSDFEKEHGISLPTDYRAFLMEVGNGGAGPAYGLFKLGEMDDGFDEGPWGGVIGVLAKPFPHTSGWNDASGMPIFDDAWENTAREEQYEREYGTWENTYWGTENINGAIPICHLGCAVRQWLVITGPEKGNVWNDYRTDHEGLQPLQTGGRDRVTFIDWYLAWLDEALKTVR